MAAPAHTGLTYDDLAKFPDDNLRREIIGGELFVTPAPRVRHQRAVTHLIGALWGYAEQYGGEVFPAPLDVYFTDSDVVEPDVLYVGSASTDRLEERFMRGAPDIVVEVSSPSTRRVDLTRKLDLYERHAVPDYWFVDLDADRVEVYQLTDDGSYGPAVMLGRGDTLTSARLPGLQVSVQAVLGRPDQ